MSTTIEYILTQDGSLKKRTVSESEISLNKKILDKVCAPEPVFAKNLLMLKDLMLSAKFLPAGTAYISAIIPGIRISTYYTLNSGALYPTFGKDDGAQMALSWKAPENMDLIAMVSSKFNGRRHDYFGFWMIARDKPTGKKWKLPLPNLHSDGSFCMGAVSLLSNTPVEMFANALDHINNSDWNADLLENNLSNCMRLFKFLPPEKGKDTITQAPVPEDWWRSCLKIGGGASDFIAV